MTKDEIRKRIKKIEGLIEEHEKNNRIAHWKPWPHQQQALDFLNAGKKVILIQGGNRIGKTVLGVNITGAACLGVQPWNLKPTIFGNQPVRVRIIAVDWEHHAKEVIVPVLREWLPKGTYVTKKNNVGIEAYWEFPETQSTIEIMTHSQETRIHEGWKGHLVWSDEPLPKDKYTANLRGLIDYSGVFIMTMTALYEPWILDEIVLSNDSKVGAITEIPMSANPMLKVADIENFARGLTQEERDVRVKGGWLQLTGRVLKEFKSDLHKVKDFKVPTDWPVIAVIDIHLNKPQAVGFYGWDKYDRIFVIDEIWENLTPEQVADEIVKRKFHYPRMKDAFIDPLSKGDNAYIKNRFNVEDTFTVIERKLMPHGIRLYPASKDKSSGIRNLKARLEGPNGMPTLFFMEHCQRHLWEIQRWVYDKEGQPVKENDHFMECLYRATLSGVKYTAPGMFGKPLQYKHAGIV
jgi:hypothetical protein